MGIWVGVLASGCAAGSEDESEKPMLRQRDPNREYPRDAASSYDATLSDAASNFDARAETDATSDAVDGCKPNCAQRACGVDDGCGSICYYGGGCINPNNCTPNCAGVTCGDANGCGGTCLSGGGCIDRGPFAGTSQAGYVACGHGIGDSGTCQPISTGFAPACCVKVTNATPPVVTSVVCAQSCQPDRQQFDCDEPADCQNGKVCCLDVNFGAGPTARCVLSGANGKGCAIASQPRLCKTNADCNGEVCCTLFTNLESGMCRPRC